jgi:hypothetical protein
MKLNIYHIIGFIVYTALIVLVTYLLMKPQPTNVNGFNSSEQSRIDSLNIKIGELEGRQRISDSLVAKYKQDLAVLDHKMDSTKIRVTQIRKYYENKIKDVSSYTPSELDRFFADRYRLSK